MNSLSVYLLNFYCIAYREDGTLCGEPAKHLDIQRGGLVCDEHQPTRSQNAEVGKSRMRRELEDLKRK